VFFPAAFLAQIEEVSEKNLASHFDLIVGTSTGGIIALALGLGLSAKGNPRSLCQRSRQYSLRPINAQISFWRVGAVVDALFRAIRRRVAVKYAPAPLRAALDKKFGERFWGQHQPSGDSRISKRSARRIRFLRRPTIPGFDVDWRESAVDCRSCHRGGAHVLSRPRD